MSDGVDGGGSRCRGENRWPGHPPCSSARTRQPCTQMVSRCLQATRRVCTTGGLWAAGCLGTVMQADGSELRIWRDQSGNHEISARFAAFEDGIVVLEVESGPPENSAASPLPSRPAGATNEGASSNVPLPSTTAGSPGSALRTIRVPCERLAMEDQQYVAERMVPEVIDGTAIRLELLDVEQHVRLPLQALPSTWEYVATPIGVTGLETSIDLRALLASERYVSEPNRQVREASLKRFGQFPVPVQFKEGEAQLQVSVQLRQFQDNLVLALRPRLKVGHKTFDFAARALEKEGRGLTRAIAANQQKALVARQELKTLPRDLQRAYRQLKPLSIPGAQHHNGLIALKIGELEARIQRAERNLRSATRSLPLEIARLKQIQFLHETLQKHAGKVEAEFLIQRRCGEVIQPVLWARAGGQVTLGAILPVLDKTP